MDQLLIMKAPRFNANTAVIMLADDTERSSSEMTATALDWWSYATATLWRVLAILNQGFREFQDANTAVVIVGRLYDTASERSTSAMIATALDWWSYSLRYSYTMASASYPKPTL